MFETIMYVLFMFIAYIFGYATGRTKEKHKTGQEIIKMKKQLDNIIKQINGL